MAQTLFFYDLETTGLDPRNDRIMQFAGIRTDLEFNPIGEPYDVLVRLNDDTLPSPEALLITGITPQHTQSDGMSEAAFAHMLIDDIFTPDTVVIGFNNIRFDDEFIRALFWRTFCDPYEWSWKNGSSRWDMLDVVRMTRALRPEGITWPIVDGKPSNRLEVLTRENGIVHTKAHDALSDVEALIDVSRLIKTAQPQLYTYLFGMREKKKVKQLVNLEEKKPIVYTSGVYDSQFEKTTVVLPLTASRNGNIIVYDLRYDPSKVLDMPHDELRRALFASREDRQTDGFMAIPVKELQYNRAPAVAPLGVLEHNDGWKRLGLDMATVEKHLKRLLGAPHFAENIRSIFEIPPEYSVNSDPEAQLYDGFVGDGDKLAVERVRRATEQELLDLHPHFSDERLAPLLLHYKARNFPRTLSEDESREWERWRAGHIERQLGRFTRSFQTVAAKQLDDEKQFILQELQLWAESIMPTEGDDGDSSES
jgi:exodeoxyribonuclease-1